jgi:thiamine biosynthesis protein ThiI
MEERLVVIHYHEIALKGNNRDFFESVLVDNLKKSINKKDFKSVERRYGRVLVFLTDNTDESSIREKIKNVFGVANFSFGYQSSRDIEVLKNAIWEKIKDKSPKSFRVTAKRSDKNFPSTSQKIAEEIGGFLFEKFKNIKVDLKNPDLNCYVEIGDKNSFFYFKKEKGYSGLPVGTAGRVLSLISSGFDSPIASWKMMRRGCKVLYVHFFSYPYTTKASYENVKEIVKKLDRFQFGSKIFFVPFADIQKEISIKSPSSQRVILYRRIMLRIAEILAKREGIKALITGDSVGQVASQTLDNIFVISEAVNMPILRPLVGDNKNDIIDKASEIGTYELSAQPYEDCCSLFVPGSPETHGKLDEILKIEKELNIDKMIEGSISKTEIVKI